MRVRFRRVVRLAGTYGICLYFLPFSISIDVIVRHEMCEKAKPGDICVFTGTLMAIPDVAQILLSGRHLNLQKASREMGRKKDVCLFLLNASHSLHMIDGRSRCEWLKNSRLP